MLMAIGVRIQTHTLCFKLHCPSFLFLFSVLKEIISLEKQSISVLLLQHPYVSLIGKILNQNKLLDGIISRIENQVGL